MIDYQNLKNRYITSVQIGLLLNTGYEGAKHGNELLHKFCEECVEMSNYAEYDKQKMKQELELIKETLVQEIEHHFSNY